MALRHRIKEVAEAKGFTRTKLSRRADINYRTVDAVWNDPYHIMTTETLYRIAKALKVPVADLVIEEPDEEA
jgi:DNA-binding Xre family transcriptional regulator